MRPPRPRHGDPLGHVGRVGATLQYADADEEIFLGYSMGRQRNMSNETAEAIDKEIRRIVEAGYDRAKTLLNKHLDELHSLAKALLEFETLSGDEIKKVLAGEPLDRGGDASAPSLPGAGTSIPAAKRRKGGIAVPRRRGRDRLKRGSGPTRPCARSPCAGESGMKRLLLTALAVVIPLSALQAMSVATFLDKADALQRRGAFALFSSDLGLLKGEINSAGTALRAERLGRRPRRAPPRLCAPERVSINSNELLAHFRAIPPAQRAHVEVRDAMRGFLARKYPCPA